MLDKHRRILLWLLALAILVGWFSYYFYAKSQCDAEGGTLVRGVIGITCIK